MLLATFFFAVMNVFVKQLGDIPAMEIVFFRCLVAAVLCFVGIWRSKIDWRGSNRRLLLLRGGFGTAALFTFFLTVQTLPLATAVTIQYLSPIFTALIAVRFLGEQIGWQQWCLYALAFAGVFVMKGFDPNISLTALTIALFSAAASGAAYALVRGLKGKEPPLVVVLHFQLVGIAVGLAAAFFDWKNPADGWQWFCLLMTGVLTQAGQMCLTTALQSAPIARVSILGYTGLIYALFFGVFLFGETYTMQNLIGIFLVIVSVILSVIVGKPEKTTAVNENSFA